jgi:Ca-activated chloride channel family protein
LLSLLLLPPKVHRAATVDRSKLRHLVLLLDVSPSMALEDAGPSKKQSRRARAKDLIESFLDRAGADFKISVVAVYNGAKPVVVDTIDMEVIRNILGDLPMSWAFDVGNTRLFDGLEEVAKIAHPWRPDDATLLVVTDGDTVPASGMPKMPASINHTLIIGVGDSRAGSFIDGRQSRQDVATLRQTSARLGGEYHDGNEKQIPTDLVRFVSSSGRTSPFDALTRREYALLACLLGACILAGLPRALHAFGTNWRPGVSVENFIRPSIPQGPEVGARSHKEQKKAWQNSASGDMLNAGTVRSRG